MTFLLGPFRVRDAATGLLLLLSNSGPPAPPKPFVDVVSAGSVFPTQYAGLRVYYHGAVQELSLVVEGDAPSGMGGIWKIRNSATQYAVYLVETSDPNATPIRIQTGSGIKALRIKI